MTDFSKPGFYRTRNGGKAEVFAMRDGFLWGRIIYGDSTFRSYSWRENGIEDGPHDLIAPWTEPRKPRDAWLNIYSDGIYGTAWETAAKALEISNAKERAVHFREVLPEEKQS